MKIVLVWKISFFYYDVYGENSFLKIQADWDLQMFHYIKVSDEEG